MTMTLIMLRNLNNSKSDSIITSKIVAMSMDATRKQHQNVDSNAKNRQEDNLSTVASS